MFSFAMEGVENATRPTAAFSHTSHSDRRYSFNQKLPTDSAGEAEWALHAFEWIEDGIAG